MKAIVVDINRCNGCHNCQLVCKDEHCGNDWSPIAKPQPQSGSFWCRVDQNERGKVPVVAVDYIPRFFDFDRELLDEAPECAYRREDGIVILDPEASVGRRDLAEKFDGVYWNDELSIPQKCTMCAHLLDGGWEAPRCVDACGTGALRFGDVEDFDDELEEAFRFSDGSNVYYLNMPKRFVAGCVVDRRINEVVIGARVTLASVDGERLAFVETDEFGDFKFDQVDPAAYTVRLAAGDKTLEVAADCTDKDVYVGVIDAGA